MSTDPWALEELADRVVALAAALEGVELVQLMPDGSHAVRLAPESFDVLVASGGSVEGHMFSDGVAWSEVKLGMLVGPVRLLLHCDKTEQVEAS